MVKPKPIAVAERNAEAPRLDALVLERKPALAALVAERIREAIMFGELSLGEAVSEDRLATVLGVSRTPVREALTALQLQGLIVIQPQRGSFVFQPTEEDVAQLCEVRSLLELGAIKLAAARRHAVTLKRLQAAEVDMETAEAGGDDRAAAKADAEFHEALFANCDNRFLVQSYALVSGPVGAIRHLARKAQLSRRSTAREHRAIIKAFAKSDLAAATSLLSTHIADMRSRFREAVRILEAAKKSDG
jgi:DNA-binding GntR family transcriptional regulator